ncbi:MAG: hypothetical protein ACOC85_01230 [Thermoplasmatota archaeon]
MTGSCHICGRPATNSCNLCGLITCDMHLKKGICAECRRGRMSEESEHESAYYKDKEDVYR